MVTLQKFRHMASQCAVAGSPTRSPTTSPVIHLRRRKTLRMLLSRTTDGGGGGFRLPRCDEYSPDRKQISRDLPRQSKSMAERRKLKDLFVSSPPPPEHSASERSGDAGDRLLPEIPRSIGGGEFRRARIGALRPLSATFRSRLLRRAWRPMLVTIPE